MGDKNLAEKRDQELKFESSSKGCALSPLHAPAVRNTASGQLPIRLIPIETVCEMLGLKRSATLAMVANGTLTKPLKFGTSRRASARWIEQEIVDFIMKMAAERDITTTNSRRKEVTA